MSDWVDPAGLADTPEHNWEAASPIIFPILRPVRTTGRLLADLAHPSAAAEDTRPLLDPGPGGTWIAYALRASGYEVRVNGDHLAAWNVTPDVLRRAAFANLARWSATAPWSEEHEDGRVLVSSTTGDGWDASRILLPEAAAHLLTVLGAGGSARVLVAFPAPDLLIATALPAGEAEFGRLFCEFVIAYAEDADDPIDERVFELRDGSLLIFSA